MDPKWLSHLTYDKQMVGACWGGSPHCPSSSPRLVSPLRHSPHPRPARFARLPWMLYGPSLQSHRTRLQMNRILSWARAAPQTGNGAAFQPPSRLADVIPPSPPSLAWPPGLELELGREVEEHPGEGHRSDHLENSGLLSPFYRWFTEDATARIGALAWTLLKAAFPPSATTTSAVAVQSLLLLLGGIAKSF